MNPEITPLNYMLHWIEVSQRHLFPPPTTTLCEGVSEKSTWAIQDVYLNIFIKEVHVQTLYNKLHFTRMPTKEKQTR